MVAGRPRSRRVRGATLGARAEGGPLRSSRQECVALLNTLLALLAVVVVMAVHAVFRLLTLPFRAVRALFRHSVAPVPLTAR